MNYTDALLRLRQRRNPEDMMIKEAYSHLSEEEPIRYLIGSMAEIDPSYTQKTYTEAERVQNQITKGLSLHSLAATFEYQGSVTKNTHIRAFSDIDILTLEARFHSLEHPLLPSSPYKGDPIKDLCQIREICSETLITAFPTATVDSSGARSLKISGGSLARDVDIVPANWYNTVKYSETGQSVFRGVHILNYPERKREKDTPFIHGALFSQRDQLFNLNMRRLVRLCKSLKYDSNRDDVPSSYDIEAIVYTMPDNDLRYGIDQKLQLAVSCHMWLGKLIEQPILCETLYVPDGKRKIFAEGKTTIAQVQGLHDELGKLLHDIEQDLTRSFRKLADARINYPNI